MSVRMKGHPTKQSYIIVTLNLGKQTINYKIPSSGDVKDQLVDILDPYKEEPSTPWEKTTPWRKVAADRIKKYKKAGLVLRGARQREGISQQELSRRTGISQNNISHIENGKRTVGEQVAKKLAKALDFDYRLLLEKQC